ncbi:nuclear body protein SP140-like protein isoform X2 [Paroedura picta]|uniref:nuclear body protein SP140-like protein isoform X2 n=1 Tax=Paroedura picta TaxID=143630 RepID=UPI004057784C
MSTQNSKHVDEIWKKFKMSISSAINKLSPFLYILRDGEIISQEVLENCEKKASDPEINLAIYSVLENLKFNELTYKKLFCKENLDAYEDLQTIYKNLSNELQHAEYWSASEQKSNPVSSLRNECLPVGSHEPVQRRSISLNKGERVQKEKKNQNSNSEINELKVCCGKVKGILYKHILEKGVSEKCIKDNRGWWFTPREFESEGGYGRWKNWKQTIRSNGVRLKKYIEDGSLPNPSQTDPRRKKISRRRLQRKGSVSNDGVAPHTQHMTQHPNLADADAVSLSTNSRRYLWKKKVTEFSQLCGQAEMEENDPRCLFQFQSSGPLIKSIRTEKRWCTPEEFVEMNCEITNGSWERDIHSKGKPLWDLIENGSLKNHQGDCSCYVCKGNKWAENDDTCAVCKQDGSLICCDSCPRSFHNVCHIPDAYTTESKKWICIYCKSESQFSAKPSSYMEQFVLRRQMTPRQLLNCQFLFLKTSCQDARFFTENPIKVVKQKLQKDNYLYVGCFIQDMREIFKSFQENAQDKKIKAMGRILQDEFEKNFREVFAIKNP